MAFFVYLSERANITVSSNEEVGLQKSCFFPSKILNLIIRAAVVVVVEMLLMQISSSSKKSSFGVVENLTKRIYHSSLFKKRIQNKEKNEKQQT